MKLNRQKQIAVILLSIAAGVYALIRCVSQYNEVKISWEAFFAPGAWEVTALLSVTGALAIAPFLVAYLAYRGVKSWWLPLLLAASLLAVQSFVVGLAIVAVVIWRLDRSEQVAA